MIYIYFFPNIIKENLMRLTCDRKTEEQKITAILTQGDRK